MEWEYRRKNILQIHRPQRYKYLCPGLLSIGRFWGDHRGYFKAEHATAVHLQSDILNWIVAISESNEKHFRRVFLSRVRAPEFSEIERSLIKLLLDNPSGISTYRIGKLIGLSFTKRLSAVFVRKILGELSEKLEKYSSTNSCGMSLLELPQIDSRSRWNVKLDSQRNKHFQIGRLYGENRYSLKLFLSHSSADKELVKELYDVLSVEGFHPWLDDISILPGQDWDLEIRKAILESRLFIFCLSLSSVTKTGYLQSELEIALDLVDQKPEGSIFIVPVRLGPCMIPERLQKWQWVNLYETNGLEKLLRSLCSSSPRSSPLSLWDRFLLRWYY